MKQVHEWLIELEAAKARAACAVLQAMMDSEFQRGVTRGKFEQRITTACQESSADLNALERKQE